MKNPRGHLARLLAIMLFDHTSLNMTFPILTLLFFDASSLLFAPQTSHAVRSLWYGVCIATPHILIIFAAPLLSSLSDYYGRKPLLAIGTLGAVIFALTTGFGILSGMLSILLAGRVIQGLFSKTNPIAQAVIGDITNDEKKVLYMGYLQLAISIGAFVGPVMGGYFARRFFFSSLNFSLPFFIAALIGLISFLLTILFFKETLPIHKRQTTHTVSIQSITTLFCKKQVLAISLLLLLCQISWSLYYQFIPPLLKTHFHFSDANIGLFVGAIAFWLAVATGIGIKICLRYFSLSHLIIFSASLILIGLLMTVVACMLPHPSHVLLWLSAIPTAAGDVITYSCITALYSHCVAQDEQGRVMGLCFIIVSITWACTGLLGGVLTSISVTLPILITPIGILLLIIIYWQSDIGKMINPPQETPVITPSITVDQ